MTHPFKTVQKRWIVAKVVEAGRHIAKCKRFEKGNPMKVAYEDIRLRPKGEPADELIRTESDDVSIDASYDDGTTGSAAPDVPSSMPIIPEGKPCKDIGDSDIGSKTLSADLESDEQITLAEIKEVICVVR